MFRRDLRAVLLASSYRRLSTISASHSVHIAFGYITYLGLPAPISKVVQVSKNGWLLAGFLDSWLVCST